MAPPKYIVVEGPIGVGKTSLSHRLAARLGAKIMLERFDDNPFLRGFYEDRDRYALKTQLFFLMERFDQQRREVAQPDLFDQVLVSDYLFTKDRFFAALTLDPLEMRLYERVFTVMEREVPRPDLVIYLNARLDVLLERIQRRGRTYERGFDPDYLTSVREFYVSHFERYEETPLLVVETSEINLAEDGNPHFERILGLVREGISGRKEYRLPGSLFE